MLQDVAKSESREKRLLEALLDRKWLLAAPDCMIDCISVTDSGGSQVAEAPLSCSYSNDRMNPLGDIIKAKKRKDKLFFVLRDDLLHPLINGNKARKLDALLPVLGDHGVTDVVSCYLLLVMYVIVYIHSSDYDIVITDEKKSCILFEHFVIVGYMWRLSKCTHSCCW